jgi:hypothetical protein
MPDDEEWKLGRLDLEASSVGPPFLDEKPNSATNPAKELSRKLMGVSGADSPKIVHVSLDV